jgi:hypothetical protein
MVQAVVEGYDTSAIAVGRVPRSMPLAAILAMSEAVSKDIGLLATFLGIGLIVNVIVVFIVVLVRGEHQQNRER